MANLNKLFKIYNKAVGGLSGERYDIYRPNYTALDQQGTLIATGRFCRLDTRALTWAEPSLAQGMYFDIFVDRDIVQIGDVLLPTGLSPTATGMANFPVVTIGSISAIKPCVGLLTDVRGSIANGAEVIYSNVRWQWAAAGTPKAGINSPLEDSMPFDRRKVLLYKRQGVGMPVPLTTGMQLIDDTDGQGRLWNILDILTVGNYTQLQVEEDGR